MSNARPWRHWLLLHFRPARVPSETLALSLSWGLGGMAATLAAVQLMTGMLLKFVYDPTPAGAYASIQLLIASPMGRLMRNLHHWGANVLILVVFLHFLRVFFTSAFHRPRRMNWLIGLALLAAVVLSNFTGYLLPWDQLAYWAVTVSTGMLEYIPLAGLPLQQWLRGGPDLGPQTLRLFYALHTALLPVLLTGLMGFHFWRVRRAGGLVRPAASAERPGAARLPAWPHLWIREMAMTAVILAVLLVLAVGLDAPLKNPANPGLSPNPTQAPWYFAGFQELLLHVHPILAVFVIPLMGGAALIALPFWPYRTDPGGIWFVSPATRQGLLCVLVSTMAATIIWILLATKGVYANGFMVLFAIALAMVGGVVFRKREITVDVWFQMLFAAVLGVFVVLTVVGVFFRAENMRLSLPW